MELAARVDDYGKPAWIILMILGFIIFWPIGLGLLAYLIWSGRMGCWKHGGAGRWHNQRKSREGGKDWWSGKRMRSSGNMAFDEYRVETLRRLEEEQEDFVSFLERLRHAKDKAEFDQFMDDRRRNMDRPAPEGENGSAPQPNG